MIVEETVTITRTTLDAAAVAAVATADGYEIQATPVSIVLRREYRPEKGPQAVLSAIRSQDHVARIRRSLVPKFDAADFQKADLVAIDTKEVEVSAELTVDCRACGRPRIDPTRLHRIKKINWKEHVVRVNGDVIVVSSFAVEQLRERRITGMALIRLKENYFGLLAESSLGRQRVRDEEVIGYRGECASCGALECEAFFGPLRYPRSSWSGDDAVYSAFEDGPVFSVNAVETLRVIDQRIGFACPVYLDA